MNRIHVFILALGMLFPMMAVAQTDVALDTEFGGRLAVGMDKKIVKGLHVSLAEEARFDNNFSSLNRLQTTVGVDYKVHPNVKVGIGYAFINGYSASNQAFKNARHRVMADVMGTLRLDDFNLSLKERLQMTHRTGDFNAYQNPANALMLKSRLMVKYKGFDFVKPYAYVEMRNYLNAPVIAAAYDGSNYFTLDDYSETGEAGWFLTGFNGGYVNRWRGSVGIDVKIGWHNTLNFYILGDYVTDKVVDANAEGTKLKSYTREKGFKVWAGAEYEFAF